MARRKITEATIDAAELPDITANQQRFVEGIVSGMTASDAYRKAYDCSDTANASIWTMASRLRSDVKVSLWIDAVKAAGFGKVSCTYDEHMTELARLRAASERSGNYGAAVQAEQLRGKVAGHYVDQVRDMTTYSPIDTLKDIATHSPELAAMMAAKANIPWDADDKATKH